MSTDTQLQRFFNLNFTWMLKYLSPSVCKPFTRRIPVSNLHTSLKVNVRKKRKRIDGKNRRNESDQSNSTFLQTRGQNRDFLAQGPHRFNLLGKLRAFAFNKRASCNGYMN